MLARACSFKVRSKHQGVKLMCRILLSAFLVCVLSETAYAHGTGGELIEGILLVYIQPLMILTTFGLVLYLRSKKNRSWVFFLHLIISTTVACLYFSLIDLYPNSGTYYKNLWRLMLVSFAHLSVMVYQILTLDEYGTD